MDEVRRFARYTLPGLVFLVQIAIALFFTAPQCLKHIISYLKEINTIGVWIGAIFGSGALGFIFSIFYFSIFSLQKDHFNLVLNHNDFISFLQREGYTLRRLDGNRIPNENLTKKDYYNILTKAWRTSRKTSKIITGIDPWIDRIIDILHGLGANIVGAIFAYFTYLYVLKYCNTPLLTWESFFAFIGWFLFILCCICSYRSTRSILRNIINATMIDAVHELESIKNPPVWIKNKHILILGKEG